MDQQHHRRQTDGQMTIFLDGNIPTGTPITGALNAGGVKTLRFSTNISLYLRHDAR